MAVKLEREIECLDNAFSDQQHGAGSVQIADEDGELVAAKAGHRIFHAHALLQPIGHSDQQLVPRHMAQAVVDELEAVEVEEEHAHSATLAMTPRQDVPQPVQKQCAIGQTGKRIVKCLMLEGRFSAGSLCNIVRDTDRPSHCAYRAVRIYRLANGCPGNLEDKIAFCDHQRAVIPRQCAPERLQQPWLRTIDLKERLPHILVGVWPSTASACPS